MTGQIFRYEVPVDDRWHEISGCGTPLHVDCRDPRVVEFWAWHRDDVPASSFRVYGTGHPIPDGTKYRGTVIAPGGQLVWHLIETP
jgi:poly(3-hydroxybutyrate) depolymerase